ncbi:hypothetical protein F5Y01DRAFT_298037 [Xylaria sp. FL0043]|nr:hypothetical protein F5Y01DRAFT_298037 [Xylaria sp. FL0043]
MGGMVILGLLHSSVGGLQGKVIIAVQKRMEAVKSTALCIISRSQISTSRMRPETEFMNLVNFYSLEGSQLKAPVCASASCRYFGD